MQSSQRRKERKGKRFSLRPLRLSVLCDYSRSLEQQT